MHSILPLLATLMPGLPSADPLLAAVDSADNQAGLTLTPDGRQAFFTRWSGAWGEPPSSPPRILTLYRIDDGWSPPETAWFSGTHADDDPFVDPDGQWLYFVSDRPWEGDPDPRDTDLWRVRLTPGARPERLVLSEAGPEFSPVVTRKALYFAAMRADGPGQGDLYRAPRTGDGFGAAVPLGPAINAGTGEWNVYVDASETLMLLEVSGRASNVSESGDLYAALATPDGWSTALPLTRLNTAHSELLARPAGLDLLFTRGRWDTGRADLHKAHMADVRSDLDAAWRFRLWVVNRSSHELSEVELPSGRTLSQWAVGEGPHLLARDGAFGVTAAHGVFPSPHAEPVTRRPPWVESVGGIVTALDLVTSEQRWQTDSGCRRPHGTAVLDRVVAVTCEDRDQIVILDRMDGRILQRLDSGGQGSHVLVPVNDDTFAVSHVDDGSISLLSVQAGVSPRVVVTGGGSEAMTVAPDGRLWVAATHPAALVAVDPEAARVVARIESPCTFPIDLEVHRNTLWVACHGSRELVGFGLDLEDDPRRIDLPSGPLNLVIHPVHDLAWVSLPRDNAVVEVDLSRGVMTRRMTVGIEPDGLQLVPLPE